MLARLGRVAEAEHRLAADPEPPPEAYRQRRVRWLRANAELAAARGNHAEAVDRLETLAALVRDSAMVEELIWILIALGREKAHLDRAAAVIELRQAAALSDQIGAVTHGRFVTRALRDLGIRTWRRSPRADVASRSPGVGDLSTLSAREREVAGWIAAGRSNREVGEALDISPKTVRAPRDQRSGEARDPQSDGARHAGDRRPGTGFPR